MKRIVNVFYMAAILVLTANLIGAPSMSVRALPDNESHPALQTSAPSASDSDGDGLSNTTELSLGTDPNNVDSDCDYINDSTEVGNPAAPANADGTGPIDALENNSADSDVDTTNDNLDSSVNAQATCGRFFPFAIKNDGIESTRLEVRVTGNNVSAVNVATSINATILKLDGVGLSFPDFITLYDDGTHGDQLANDGLWSRNGFTSTYNPSRWAFDVSFSSFMITDANGTLTRAMNNAFSSGVGGIKIGVVKASEVQSPTSVKTWVQTTSNLINIVDPLGSLDSKDSINSNSRMSAVSQLVYSTLGTADDYDFLMFYNDSYVPASYSAFFYNVKNDVENIGQFPYDYSSFLGSSGKLQGIMFMNMANNGPSLHELMHRWAAPDLTSLNFHQCQDTKHWGFVGLGKGQLGGFDPATLVDNGSGNYAVGSFGTNANGGDSVNYAQLELYLAGFLDASAVADITVPVNIDCNSIAFAGGQFTFTANSISTVSIAQIQSMLGGPRTPSVATSQKAFKAAPVIVSQYLLTPTEMAFYNGWSKNLGATVGTGGLKSFHEATGNVATLDTTSTITVAPTPSFADVPANYWAFSFIERLRNSGITSGCGVGTYCPDNTVTRAEMAVFLLRGMHTSGFTPPAINGVTNFTDVATSHWAAAWIKQLAAESITSGCGAGIYCPDSTVTRAQMAVFLLKAKHGASYTPPSINGSTGFTDVAADYWAAAWIKQLAAEGVTSGCGNGIYCPDNSVTRAQMAVFLVKVFGLP